VSSRPISSSVRLESTRLRLAGRTERRLARGRTTSSTLPV
jgi:hypothetical protein